MNKYILTKEYPCSLKKGSEVFWNGLQYEHLKVHDQAGIARIFKKEEIENNTEYWQKVEEEDVRDKLGEGCEYFTVKTDFIIHQGNTECDTIKQIINDTRK